MTLYMFHCGEISVEQGLFCGLVFHHYYGWSFEEPTLLLRLENFFIRHFCAERGSMDIWLNGKLLGIRASVPRTRSVRRHGNQQRAATIRSGHAGRGRPSRSQRSPLGILLWKQMCTQGRTA
eukprot:751530-Amphidinium_carterae.1